MRKNRLVNCKFILILLIAFGCFTSLINSKQTINAAETNTESKYVNTVTDLETTSLAGGATLYEQKMSSLLNGDEGKRFQEHFVQWVDIDSYGSGLQLVTWTYQAADKWQQATTKKCAENWEKYHPGWIVVAGINGDFFNNSGTCTFEPTNNFMADGEMYRADYNGGYRKVIGFKDDHTYVTGDPQITGLKLQIMDNNSVVNEFDFAGYNTQPKTDGTYLLTKDVSKSYDLTGYTVYVGEYSICRISNGANNTVFVKGEILSSRPGTANESPKQQREITNDDGSTKVVTTREFYIVTKDASFESVLTEGTSVRCQHNFTGSWSEVTQSCGFVYQMLVNGESQFQKSGESFIYTDHPRTFIGFKEDGTPVLMVVDGRGKTAAEKNYGVSLFEGAEIMKLAGCVNAFNLDGGGSSTLVVRNEADGFDVINRPSDGSERSTGNAIFLVMRDPGFTCYKKNATATTVRFDKKTGEQFTGMENVKITLNGVTKEVAADQESVTFEGLMPDTTYDSYVTYTYEGKEYSAKIKASTKSYDPGISIVPNSYGFTITRYNGDDVLKTIAINLYVDDECYQIGDVDEYVVTELFKDTIYNIRYEYTVKNLISGETYTKSVESKEYKTLSYEAPFIKKIEENRKTDDSLRVRYAYEDPDGLLTNAYIYLNDVKYKLEEDSGTYTFEELNFNKNTYEVKVVLEYEVDEIPYYVYSTTLVYEKAPCTHEYDNDCDEACNLCEEVRTVTHSYVEATCQAPKTCKVCGVTEGEKLEHTPVTDEAVDATCKEEGLTEGSHCSVCNEVLVKQEKVEKKEHTPVTDEAVDATCKEEGLTEGSHCSVCNEVLVKQEKVEKKEHTYDSKCDEDCNVCKEKRNVEHDWVEATKKEPKTCKVCGATEGAPLKGCKKKSLATILISINLFVAGLMLIRKKR